MLFTRVARNRLKCQTLWGNSIWDLESVLRLHQRPLFVFLYNGTYVSNNSNIYVTNVQTSRWILKDHYIIVNVILRGHLASASASIWNAVKVETPVGCHTHLYHINLLKYGKWVGRLRHAVTKSCSLFLALCPNISKPSTCVSAKRDSKSTR